jgi:hypothetical protein
VTNPPGPESLAKQPLDRSLLEGFRAGFGPDYWSMAVEGWFIIGLNVKLFGSDFRLFPLPAIAALLCSQDDP